MKQIVNKIELGGRHLDNNGNECAPSPKSINSQRAASPNSLISFTNRSVSLKNQIAVKRIRVSSGVPTKVQFNNEVQEV